MIRISATLSALSLLLMSSGCGAQVASEHHLSDGMSTETINFGTAESPTGEAWVVNAYLSLTVDSVDETLDGLEKTLEAQKGSITNIERQGRGEWSRVTLTIRVAPDGLKPTMSWLRTQGQVDQEKVEREEVSRTLVEREIALRTAKATLARLETLLQKPDIGVVDILAIEKEMTRLRGEIETHESEQRLLKDRVTRSTLVVNLSHRQKVKFDPYAKFYLSGRSGLLIQGDDMTPGFGVSLHAPEDLAEFHLDADFFPARGDDPKRFLLTVGSSSYSDFFGRGDRSVLNPYLGLRFGYASIEDHHFVFGAEFGLELFKHRYFLVDARVQGLGIVGKRGLDWIGVAGIGLGTVY